RQRLRPSLEETSAIVCPRCAGQGAIRDVKSLCLSILRVLQEEANKKKSAEIRAIVPLSVAAYLLNEKRNAIAAIEAQSKTRLLIIPNPSLETPHYEIQSLTLQDGGTPLASYEIVTAHDDHEDVVVAEKTKPAQQAAVQAPTVPQAPAPSAAPVARAPVAAAPRKKGFFASLLSIIGLSDEEQDAGKEQDSAKEEADPQRSRRPQGSGQGAQNRNSRQGRSGGRNDRDRNDRDRPERDRQERDKPAVKADEDVKTERKDDRRPARDAADTETAQGQGRGRRRGGNQQGGQAQGNNRQRPTEDEALRKDSTVEAVEADATEDTSGEAKRRRGDRRPRNTAKRVRGPHPDGVETTQELATAEAGIEATELTEVTTLVDSDVDSAALEVTTDTTTVETDDAAAKPRRRRSRGGRSRRGRGQSGDTETAESADGTESADDADVDADTGDGIDLPEDTVVETAVTAEVAAEPAEEIIEATVDAVVAESPLTAETVESVDVPAEQQAPEAAKPATKSSGRTASARSAAKQAANDAALAAQASAELAAADVVAEPAPVLQPEPVEAPAPLVSEPEAAQYTAAIEPDAPVAAPAATEAVADPVAETPAPAPVVSGGRAPNDPREIRRRRLEEEARLAAQAAANNPE
ncbi:MAG: hypothetical protein Q8S94_13850, partial [Pseudohongiella sp.]|nr:hypothetical protein [Pseudohongiella sp.]